MIIGDVRPPLSGKQSDESPDTSGLSKMPSEFPYLGSKQRFLASSDVRYGSQADASSKASAVLPRQ